MTLQNEIDAVFAAQPDVLYGFADVDGDPDARGYRAALVFAVPYGRQLTPRTYTEPEFEAGIQMARARLEGIVGRLEAVLGARGTPYRVPPVAQADEIALRAPFSFKHAATRAGIGWYGKNDVIITERYGPRVRLSAVLIDAPLCCAEPITESRCPDGCSACVRACPCRALKGVRWDATKRREDIIDFHRCNRMRSAFIPRLGRKSACGLCLAACPFGAEQGNQIT